MGLLYYAPIEATAVTTSIQLWSIQPATDDPIWLHAWEITQHTEFGDAEAEALHIALVRRTGAPTGGLGGAVTPESAAQGVTATTATVLQELTTDWAGGSVETFAPIGWNVRAPYLWLPPPEGRIQVKDNDVIYLDLVTVPADAIGIHGWILFEQD